GFGVKTARCAASVAHALAMIEERVPDFALLDVGLIRESSFEVAARLATLGVPFAFVTGYGGNRTEGDYADRPDCQNHAQATHCLLCWFASDASRADGPFKRLNRPAYSITSSALAINVAGTERPNAPKGCQWRGTAHRRVRGFAAGWQAPPGGRKPHDGIVRARC